ncbi:MAG: L-lactate dehydrogenase [Bacillota bacterium]
MEKTNKIVIVGAGNVGATTAYALLISGIASELVLYDINRQKAEGEIMDLAHGASFVPPARLRTGYLADCREADIIIFTAGAAQQPGETRLDLVDKNTRIVEKALLPILEQAPEALVLMVTNPVDVLTYQAWKLSGLSPERVLGSGTVLDSARFRHVLGQHCGVDVRNVHGYILGEHGDSELAAWSSVHIGGIRLDDYCLACGQGCGQEKREEMFRQVRDAAYQIIQAKGATYYAVGLAVRRICEAILRDEHSILTVSSLMQGEYGLRDVCLSVPCVIGRQGRIKVLELNLTAEEKEKLQHSAAVIASYLPATDRK